MSIPSPRRPENLTLRPWAAAGGPAFLVAQAFNVIWTLLLAYLLFGGLLFPAPVF